jgi:hypothetical protein
VLKLILYLKNENGHLMQFCCGDKEYVLEPGEEISIEVSDQDCMYFDEVTNVQ